MMDEDRTGTLSMNELAHVLEFFGMPSTPEWVVNVLAFDAGGDGGIGLEEFSIRCANGGRPAERKDGRRPGLLNRSDG